MGCATRAHDIIPYEVKVGEPPHEAAASLRPGVTIKGRVEGPDGQTVTDAFILTTLHITANNPFWRGDFKVPVHDGHYELHGLAPDASTRIFVLDAEHQWGASVEISGKQAGEDLTLRLQPCGQAKARFVGPDGKPVEKHRPNFEFVATSGLSRYSLRKQDRAKPVADEEHMANVDRKHYWNGPLTDAEGRITLPDLIPGRTTGSSTSRRSTTRIRGCRLAMTSPSNPARPSTWAISSSRNRRRDRRCGPKSPRPSGRGWPKAG